MVNILALPEEILSKIFGYIDSNVQLAQCRLVCLKWSHPANSALFSNTIIFKTKEKALALYGQLFNDPSKGCLIRYIHFEKTFDAFWMVKAIFNTASIANVERFSGITTTPDFYTWILDFTKGTTSAFPKLKQLPKYNKALGKAYYDALLKFRSTITTIDIGQNLEYLNDTTKNLIQQLGTFENLTTLKYNGRFRQLSEMELLLKGCNHLRSLMLRAFLDDQAMDKATLDAWMTQNAVAQVESLEKLIITGHGECNLAEYLTYKYPNITDITFYIDYYSTLYADNIVNFENNMDRLLQTISRSPKKKFQLLDTA